MNVDIFKDKEFAECRAVLDSEMKRLQAAGKGTTQKKAEIITYEAEEILWEKVSWVMVILDLFWIPCYL